MAASTGTSFVLSTIFTVLIFSGMQIYKPWFTSSNLYTIFGGYLGSLLFVLSLTAFGNLKNQLFGKALQVKLYPEVIICLIFALFASVTIHRVCGTTCLLFSVAALYYMNRYSQMVYSVQTVAPPAQEKKKRK